MAESTEGKGLSSLRTGGGWGSGLSRMTAESEGAAPLCACAVLNAQPGRLGSRSVNGRSRSRSRSARRGDRASASAGRPARTRQHPPRGITGLVRRRDSCDKSSQSRWIVHVHRFFRAKFKSLRATRSSAPGFSVLYSTVPLTCSPCNFERWQAQDPPHPLQNPCSRMSPLTE